MPGAIDLARLQRIRATTLARATSRQTLTRLNERIINPLTLGMETAPDLRKAALELQRDMITRAFVLPNLSGKALAKVNYTLDQTAILGAFGLTNIGSRPAQEDHLVIFAHDGKKYLIAADGVGGHQAGSLASKMAVDGLQKAVGGGQTLEAALGSLVGEIAARQAQLGQTTKPMGTTLVAVEIDGNKATIHHVGNSLALLVGAKETLLLTRPHVQPEAIKAAAGKLPGMTEGEIREAVEGNAPFTNPRVIDALIGSAVDQNTIVYALGLDLPAGGKATKSNPYLLSEGDRLVIYTDGMGLKLEEILQVMSDKQAKLSAIAESLIDGSLSRKQMEARQADNASVIVYEHPGAKTTVNDLSGNGTADQTATVVGSAEADRLIEAELSRQLTETTGAVATSIAKFAVAVKAIKEEWGQIAVKLAEARGTSALLDFQIGITAELVDEIKAAQQETQRRYEVAREQIVHSYDPGTNPIPTGKLEELRQSAASTTDDKRRQVLEKLVSDRAGVVEVFAHPMRNEMERRLANLDQHRTCEKTEQTISKAAIESNLSSLRLELQQIADATSQLETRRDALVVKLAAQRKLFDTFHTDVAGHFAHLLEAFQGLEKSIS